MDMTVREQIQDGVRKIGKIIKDVREEVGIDLKTVQVESGLEYRFLHNLEEGTIGVREIKIAYIKTLMDYLPLTYLEKKQIVENLRISMSLSDKEHNYERFYEQREGDNKLIESMIYDN